MKAKLLLLLLFPFLAAASVKEEFEFAEDLYRNGLYRICIKELKKIAKEHEGTLWEKKAFFLMGEAFYKMKEWKKALQAYKRVAQKSFGEEKAAVLLKIGDCLKKAGMVDEAISLYKDVSKQYEDTSYGAEALYLLSLSLRDKGDWQQACALLEQIPKKYPTSPLADSAFYEAGRTLYMNAKYNRARELFGEIAKIKSPLSAKASYFLALCFYEEGEYKKAEEAFTRFILKEPSHPLCKKARFMIACTYLHQAHYKEAAEYFQDIMLMYPKDEIAEQASFWYAESLYRSKNWKEALEGYRDFLRAHPNSSLADEAEEGIAFCFFKLKDYKRCIDSLHTLLRKREDRRLYLLLAESYREIGNFKESREALINLCKRSQRKDSLFHEARLLLAWIHLEEEEGEEALKIAGEIEKECEDEEILKRVKRLQIEAFCRMKKGGEAKKMLLSSVEGMEKEEVVALSLRVADTLFYEGFFADARSLYKRAAIVAEGREKEFAQYCVAWCLFKEAEYPKAQKILLSLLKEARAEEIIIKAKRLLGDCKFNQKKFLEAYDVYAEILSKYPGWEGRDGVIYQMGWCYYKMEKYKEAAQEFERLLTVCPSSPLCAQAMYWIGWCHFQQRAYEEAKMYFHKVYKDFKGSKWAGYALYKLADTFYNMKDFSNAFRYYKKVAEEYKEMENLKKDAMKKLVACLKAQGKMEECIKLYKDWAKEAKTDEEKASLYFNMASLYGKLGRGGEQESILSFIVKEYKDTSFAPKALYEHCSILFKKGAYREALARIKEFLKKYPLHPLYPKLYLWSALCLFREGKKMEAMRTLSAFLKKFQGREDLLPLCHLYIAHIKKEDDKEEALSIYKRILKDYPESESADEAAFCIAEYFFDEGDYDGALSFIERILAKEAVTKISACAQLLRARCFHAQGRKDEAVVEYLKVSYFYKEFDAQAQEARMFAAGILEERGEREKALRLYQMVKESAKDEKIRKRAQECIKRLSH